MHKKIYGLLMAGALAIVPAGCHRADQAAGDADNAAAHIDSAANHLAAVADRLADKADDWGDNASARIDEEGARTGERIANANDRLADIVGPAASSIATDDWVGRWKGVEGLTLVIEKDKAKGDGHYILRDTYTLDDHGVFKGVADGDAIRFTRPDGVQVLRPTDGAATGLKYLAGKRECLTVKSGEGYCRD